MNGWPFAKGHGTGNDFVILRDPDGTLPLTTTAVAALCDRRRGIGADGILRVVRTSAHPDAAALGGTATWFMDYWNGDGSLAEICLNGVRVFVRYLVETGLAEPGQGMRIATRAGVVGVDVSGDRITVELDPPRIYGSGTAGVGRTRLRGTAVDVGNPHLVCEVDDATLASLALGSAPDLDPELFPDSANVEFAVEAPPPPGADCYRRMRVYERGAGETLSCGSGVCAVAAVALAGASGTTTGTGPATVVVDVPGGRLTVTMDDRSCRLSGPAVIVASGHVDLDAVGGSPADRPADGAATPTG